ncbi:putative E3 ubiquitin-protein ligase TOM1 [Candida viswanathii]|uniref:HECT-type E3 ubiquitin transferase n=1 Tax=Candida viswanathii TaxID=5486 RepID=A0A367XPE6_9ASCO|nr:putative E3 ubiquitin-protein ligase TOM1 [Candida viswanathii]
MIIIGKRDHQQRMEMAEPLKSLIDQLTNCPVDELPQLLIQNLKWQRPRGDLFHWIPLLNRFDDVFEQNIKKYALDQEHVKLQLISQQDEELIVACLRFTYILLDHCSDKQVYSSSERIYDLINCPSLEIRLRALEVAVVLAEKYVQTSSSRFSAPKGIKNKVLEIAKSYPPLVPIDSTLKRAAEKNVQENPDEKPSIIGDHYNFVYTLNADKEFPSKWRSINYQYYKSSPTTVNSNNGTPRPNSNSKDKLLLLQQQQFTVTEGLHLFHLPEESVKKLSLQQLLDKGQEVLPKEAWFSYGIHAQVAKSFNTNSPDAMALREKLIQIKCLAVGFTCCMLSSQVTSTKLFEAEPYIFSFLTETILPENSTLVSQAVYFAAIRALECISFKKIWGAEMVRTMGGNVSHGMLYQCIRHIWKMVKDQDEDYFEEGYIHFFNMVGNLINNKSLVPKLTAGGILNDLMPFLNLRTKYRWSCSAAVHLITMYLSTAQDSLNDFVANNGFNLLIENIGYEVDFALENPDYNGGAPKDAVVYYSISLRQANYIRNLMKLVSDLIQSDQGDRLRNLFDSPLLESFNKILTHPHVFGPLILAATVDSVFFIIHNEPTAFAILNEAKVIDTILDNYENLFLPSSVLLMSLPEVLGAICLNNEGLRKVKEKKVIQTFFKSFYNLKNAKELVKTDMATNLGCSFDELGRHYPTLKPLILSEIQKLIEDISKYVDERLPGIEFYSSEAGSLYNSKVDDSPVKVKGQKAITCWEDEDYTYLLDNVYFFLGGLLQDSGQWGSDAILKIKFDSWVKFLTLKNAPYDYAMSNGISSLMGILKYFDDENRDYGLPIIIADLENVMANVILQKYIDFEGEESYFSTVSVGEATELLKLLNTANVLLYSLTEIYINLGLLFNERLGQIIDLFAGRNLLTRLVKLLNRSVLEEIILKSNTPDEILKMTHNFPNDSPPLQVNVADPAEIKADTTGTTAKFKNTLQLRTFAYYFRGYIPLILASVVRACIPKRQDHHDGQARQDAVEILLFLGEMFTATMGKKFDNEYYRESFILSTAYNVLYVLSQKERSKDQVYTPFAVSLFQNGFFEVAKNTAISLWDRLLEMDPKEVAATSELKYISTQESSIVKNALSQILMIFARAVNADNVPNMQFAKFYFYQGYGKSIENPLTSALLIQVRGEALSLLEHLVGCKSKLAYGLAKHPSNIPTPLVEQAVYITKNIFQGKKESSGTEFVPFDVRNISPPSEQFAYLISLGMTEEQATHYFEHGNDLNDIASGRFLKCQEIDINEEQWKSMAASIKDDGIDFTLEFPKYKSTADILKERKETNLVDTWLQMVKLYPKVIVSVSDLFSVVSTNEFVNTITAYLSEVTWPVSDKDTFAVNLHLISLLLQSNQTVINQSSVYEKLIGLLSPDTISNDTVKEPFFPILMSILEQALVHKDAPVPESTRHETIQFYNEPDLFIMDDETKDKVFEAVINLHVFDDAKSANGVARVLVLYARDTKYAEKIATSTVLRDLLKLTGTNIKEKVIAESLKTSAVLIFRYCFETTQVLENYMTSDVTNLFNGSVRHVRDLQSCLKENASLVFRDSKVFTDVLSKNILLDGYGGGDFFINKIPIRPKKKDESSQDVEMSESQETAKPWQSLSIMNQLLSELMSVVKTDWLSDPPSAEPKDDNKDAPINLFANEKFSYACYLLQTITELLGSYKQAKLEFLTFSKKAQDEIKPKPTALNFFIHQLVPTRLLELSSGAEFERRCAISSIAKMALLSLVSSPMSATAEDPAHDKKEDIDLALIRRFVVDLLMKVLKDTAQLKVLGLARYGKLLDLFELSGLLISTKFRDAIGPLLNKKATQYDQYLMTKIYIEKQVPNLLTTLIAELDLNFPQVDKVVKAALKPITFLGKNKVDYQELFLKDGNQADNNDDDDILPEGVDYHEETPDLFRNSTLGMYDINSEDEDEFYDAEDPVERIISEAELSESSDGEDSSELSAIDSDLDVEDIEMEVELDGDGDLEDIDGDDDDHPHVHEQDDDEGENEDIEEVSDLGDIEIIDDLDLGSQSDVEDEELSSWDEGEEEEEDGEASEYDEDELDGWIEQFDDGEESTEDPQERARPGDRFVAMESTEDGGIRLRFFVDGANIDNEDESDVDLSDSESRLDFEFRMVTPTSGARRIIDQAGFTQLERTSPALSLLLDGLFREGNFRGSLDEPGNATIGRLFENMMQLGRAPKHAEQSHKFHIKSTKERWVDALKMFYSKDKDVMCLKLVPAIVNRIEDESVAIFKKKQEEQEKIRKEREEKRRKQLEEEERKRAEEARQREENAANAPEREPVMVRIGDRDVDISGTDIDPDYIEALPEDMREEVLALYVRERRANATFTDNNAREIDPDFLDALPDNIREEILQQESMARRYAELEASQGDFDLEDADADVQFDVDDEHVSDSRRSSATTTLRSQKKPSGRIFFTPLSDKQGIAALIRLLFSPLTIGQREHIYHALQYMCNNKQSRIEIMSLMIAILHDCFIMKRPVQKVYTQVCSRASGSKDGKRQYKLPVGATQISVGIQIVEAVDYLLERNNHLRYFLLTEHENMFIFKKEKKNIAKENKFPINYILRILESKLVTDDQTLLDILARVLQVASRALHVLKHQRDHQDEDDKPFAPPPPVIPDENYKQIIKILTGNDCSNTTFRRTISAMQNFSVLKNAQRVFSLELSEKASELGQKLIVDLNNLTKELIEGGGSESKSFSKFSAHSSDQAKLLRILTALDYMFETNEKNKEKSQDDEIEELTGLYKKLALGSLWDALSECLRVLEEKPHLHNIANALLPLIEALMVVCKHSKVRELPIKECLKYEAKKIDFTKEPIESLFFSFTDEHKKILNQMVRSNPNLMSGPFGMLVRNPRVLEFDNKKNYFDRKLHQDKKENRKLLVSVRRDQVFLDSYRALFFKPKDEFRNSKLEINFKGEQGIDAGGVTREWYQVLSRQMFNPDYALFTPVASDSTTFHPNRTSYINPEHLSFFKFIGRIIGKAIFDNCFLDCHFSRAVYKRILGKQQSLKDMETLDLEYFKSLMWMLENDITDVITEDFSVETDDYGEHKVIDLIPNGRNIPVTEENKQEYVQKVVEYRLQTSVEEQMENFLMGFHEIIPKDLVAIFDEKELELLISGLPDIDVLDWQNNTSYNNYSPLSLQIQWFWRAVKSFDNEERARLLQFATGTSKVPLNGFKELSGASGTCKFSIHRDYGSSDRLPSSHTCFNQIDLPSYETYETLRGSLLMAITEGHEGFGLA